MQTCSKNYLHMIAAAIPDRFVGAMRATPAVSVVIRVHNRAHCIAFAVESVLAQTFKDFEIIVVDDGSSDGTSDVLETFGGKIRLIRQANHGASSARNAGVRAARGNMYWRLVEISPEKASVIRKRLGYFISRRAEIACAARQPHLARALALDGILFAGNFRDFARCAGVLVCPSLVRNRARKKWPV